MTVRYTGMNPDGTGTLTDAAHVWQSASDILNTPIDRGSCAVTTALSFLI